MAALRPLIEVMVGHDSRTGSTLWTIGHSNRSCERFLELLRAHEIDRIVDVRRFPRSRRHPHFSQEPLAAALGGIGIDYVHLVDLGGHREERAGSPHVALAPGPFRGYADHMQSPEFARALARLLELAKRRRSAVMCAEARWQDCHRRLLSDRLVTEGVHVLHLAEDKAPEPHVPHRAARSENGQLVYRGEIQQSFAD